jgi:uncharacterized protein YceH (UPF0502 family)
VEARVLGALIEKEATTPEYYPLSLNALVNACNQKSNRNPVVSYDEDTVDDATLRLREKKLALLVIGSGRVNKYSQRISETLNLGRKELAVLCTLLLRGAQTLGEIRDRSERIFAFEDLEETERTLEKMAEWPGVALTRKQERHPGQKESRYVHLLCGEPTAEAAPLAETEAAAGGPSRIMLLEQEVKELRGELADLKRRFEELEAQLK